ncbi:gluconate 2-dehydrogenase subunit 3 family protein [Paenibacillus antri]|uniref:Gluconate 2-dehydrogenase subunit 3 family protein n=1 Tax=Paenibacillus antri TaxID=2582848 RepID=A0A5R9GGX7_9BACL|nr:gluconate 2-dehydrogenase subunit 3 family protein [Paenibacillus antri]TLS52648.1 gluconate 2-dehydrogenase subunit 3 family protein [Paenibacillus antri]
MDEQERPKTTDDQAKGMSRRQFLVTSGYAVGGAVLGGVLGYLLPKRQEAAPPAAPAAEGNDYGQALMFFTQEQFSIAQAATERIFPTDENGPGAKELGVAYYLDHQLASEWGFNARDYMQGPFFVGEKVQGYQGRLKRRDIFQIGLREMQNYSQSQYGKAFVNLTEEEQDAVLTAFQNDEVPVTTISASGFFSMLRSGTLEGVYSDPLYGGNKNMAGWAMRNYPGSQMSYTQIMDKDFTKVPPRSLKDHVAHS